MRSVQTHRSAQFWGSRVSPACLGKFGLKPSFPTAAGLRSVVWSFTRSLSGVPSLHGRYPLLRYYGRSDFLRLALRPLRAGTPRPFGSEVHCLASPNVSCRSASHHVICTKRAFLPSSVCSAPLAGFDLDLAAAAFPALGSWLKTSRLPGLLLCHIPPNRVHDQAPRGASALRTGSLLPVASHGRISPPQFLSATGSLT
jgi:hypothetical protein